MAVDKSISATYLYNKGITHYEVICESCGNLGTLSVFQCPHCAETNYIVSGDTYEEVKTEINNTRKKFNLPLII